MHYALLMFVGFPTHNQSDHFYVLKTYAQEAECVRVMMKMNDQLVAKARAMNEGGDPHLSCVDEDTVAQLPPESVTR